MDFLSQLGHWAAVIGQWLAWLTALLMYLGRNPPPPRVGGSGRQ
jgi:hypothetical protein